MRFIRDRPTCYLSFNINFYTTHKINFRHSQVYIKTNIAINFLRKLLLHRDVTGNCRREKQLIFPNNYYFINEEY